MDQEPTPGPEPAGGKPKLLSGVNGVIAGLTGLAVALGGLVTAYRAITEDKPGEQQAVAAEPEPAAEPAAAEEEEQPARPALYKGDLYDEDDEAFDGGSMQLEHDGERWILTADGETYAYDELATKDERLVLAHSAKYGSTLRWPVDGGEVEESTRATRDAWKTYAKVDPAN